MDKHKKDNMVLIVCWDHDKGFWSNTPLCIAKPTETHAELSAWLAAAVPEWATLHNYSSSGAESEVSTQRFG